jgi:Tfp pilus assembly protein PilN
MIRINLLPPEYAEAQRKKEQQIIFGGVGCLAMAFLLLFWGFKKATASNLQAKINEADAELKSYQTIIQEIEQIEADQKRKRDKLNVIKELNRSRLVYPVFFEDFIPIVPADIWVTSLSLEESGGGTMTIKISCKGTSNFAVATWLTNLEQSPHFSNIKLGPISYSSDAENNLPTLTFNLDTSYRHQGAFPLAEYYGG